MDRIKTEIDEVELEGDHGTVDGLTVTCSLCGHQVEVYGTSGASARRGAIMLRDECPEGQENFYEVDWEE